jgi:hypothetical protein
VVEDLIAKHTPVENFPEQGRAWYVEDNQKVRNLVSDERFLEFDVKQGWGPLCKFLKKEILDLLFPRLNDTGSFMRHLTPAMEIRRKQAVSILQEGITIALLIRGVLLAIT